MSIVLFSVSLFLSALLLFSVQPMVAKVLLPIYGGTPAVWTICMLFFQLVLLGAYGYVFLLSQLKKPLYWRLTHSLLLGLTLFFIPFEFKPIAINSLPEWNILYNLFRQLGLPLLIIGASAPLLQFAFSQTKNKSASDPYFLYAASNMGSLLALLLYPWIIERFIGLNKQFYLWNYGLGFYACLIGILFYAISYNRTQVNTAQAVSDWSYKQILVWIFLAFVPCSLMLGVTLYITTDVAATPLFWVMPLALYLLSFVFTFRQRALISHDWVTKNSIFFLIFTIIGFILKPNQVFAWELILVNVISFFILALLCHRELYLKRPKAQELTLFYFCLAIGGMLAGVFNGIIAPHVFNQIYEYPIAIVLSLAVLPIQNKAKGLWIILGLFVVFFIAYAIPSLQWIDRFSSRQLGCIFALILIVTWQQNKATLLCGMSMLFVFIFLPTFQNEDGFLLQQRSFYAVNRVVEKDNLHAFVSQSTVHGLQIMNTTKRSDGFVAYYGPLKSIVDSLKKQFDSMDVTLVGLGAGTIVCQFRDSDTIRAMEIDQQVIDIAKNPSLFTYLRDCPKTQIIKGDGRLAMNEVANGSQKLIILDAFNSDAVPVHLMTLEAFTLYKRKISKDGIILVNLSNRHLKLLPVVNAVAHSLDLMTLHISHKGDRKLGQFDSDWALLTANQDFVFGLPPSSGWNFLADYQGLLWTDDYSNIIPLIKWS